MGGIFPLLDRVLFNPDKYDEEGDVLPASMRTPVDGAQSELDPRNIGGWLFDQRALQKYLLICCQDSRGGLRDKPGKSPDYYHTCYALSGLSVSEYNPEHWSGPLRTLFSSRAFVAKTNAVHNIGPEALKRALAHFSSLPINF
jgi:hypothetical protein